MDFKVLIMGSDANAYYMARCCYEAYKKKPHLIGQRRLAFTKFSNILTIEYYNDLWIEKEFIKKVNDYAKKYRDKKIILISTNETYTEFISKNKKNLEDNLVFNLPDVKLIKTLTNKETFYKTYERSNLSFPKTIYFNITDEIKDFDIKYPLVIKPANVVKYNHVDFEGKNKIYKINDFNELKETVTKIKNSSYDDKLIIQEFIPGGDDYLFDSVVYANKNGKVEFVTFAQIGLQERTRSMVGNAAVLINGFNTTKGDTKKCVKEIKKFMESINYQGFAEVDLKYDERDNTFKVLEINARQGRCSYYVTKLGKNLVKTIVDDCLYDIQNDFTFLNDEVLLSFVPRGIIKKYIKNKEYRKKVFSMWRNVIKPMDAKDDKNFKRFLMLRKRWLHYYIEYKNSYWK